MDQNYKLDLFSGKLKIILAGTIDSPDIAKIYWKDLKAVEFKSVQFEVVWDRSKGSLLTSVDTTLRTGIRFANSLTDDQRRALLPMLGNIPKKIQVASNVFLRNPFVIAETLKRANGICGRCNKPAPFISRRTNEPYLEVHHMKRLADGGADDIKNTIVVCPNCHQELHHGHDV